jgi:hypothetical protein
MATPSYPQVRSYLEDVMTAAPSSLGCDATSLTGRPKTGGLTEFSGSYGTDECPQGMLGGAEYYRAFKESELARMAPDVLSRSVRSSWDEPFLSIITPEKPAAVSLAGYDVFGPQSFSTTTRNMTTDLRGEAAYAPNLAGEIPVGASASSYAMGAAVNFVDCVQGCGCQKSPAGIQLPGSVHEAALGDYQGLSVPGSVTKRCEDMCYTTSASASDRATCLRECGLDMGRADDFVERAGNLDDLAQDCVSQCAASGGPPEALAACTETCRRMFRGAPVSSVHPTNYYTPRKVQAVTVLRPYHV